MALVGVLADDMPNNRFQFQKTVERPYLEPDTGVLN